MSHTPGPWFVHDDTLVTTCEDARKGESVAYAGDTTIQVFHRSNAADNARLIAAAPELLEALQCVFSWAMEAEQETGKPLGEGLGYKGKMQLPVAMEKARLAIRKATGQ